MITAPTLVHLSPPTDESVPKSPYKGLAPFRPKDAPFFFGRALDRRIIVANLQSARLTLVYGASGVGKSSVLNAGVAHHLERLERENLVMHEQAGLAQPRRSPGRVRVVRVVRGSNPRR